MAEPDRIDFNTMAHGLWGVTEGCLVTVSTKMALVAAGLVVVNGQLVKVSTGSVPIGTTAQDRFDLIVVDSGGTVSIVPGVDSTSPVFPDPGLTVTVLAAVFAPAGSGDYTNNVIDKRKFLSKSLLTKIDPALPLVYNQNNTGVHYQMSGGGDTWWEGDTRLWRSAVHELSIDQDLKILGDLRVGDDITADSLAAVGQVTGSNLMTGSAAPGSAANGTIYQDSSGHLYVRRNNAWSELATLDATVPVGTVINSLQAPSIMGPLGWVALNGAAINESQYPSLFSVPALIAVGSITGTAPNRSMTLPQADGRVLVTQWNQGAGNFGGNDNNKVTVNLANMPRHRHNVTTQQQSIGPLTGRIGRNGTHGHSMSGGTHTHRVTDPGHKHRAMEGPNGTVGDPICVFWGGTNKIDALFNDRNHTYSVEPLQWTVPAFTDISIDSVGSDHAHVIVQDGDHDHPLTLDNILPHGHDVTEQDMGDSAPIDVTPAFLSVYTYVKA
jgi:microcystin-dependent protein